MVGKTSLITRYVSCVFNECNEPTIATDFRTKQVQILEEGITGDQIPGEMVKLCVWDTAG